MPALQQECLMLVNQLLDPPDLGSTEAAASAATAS
jgi:hypothetical protein